MVAKQLRIYNFKDDQIQELKLHRQLILICDGYDESQQLVNLHKTNMLNQPGQWNTKMIVSCLTQFLGPTYLDRFKPQPFDRYSSGSQDLFQEAVVAPFSKDQVKNYVEQYAKDPQAALLFSNSQAPWSAEEYMDKLAAIPNVMDLVKNPFLLTLALKALPGLAASNKNLASIRVTRAGLYDMFVDQWLETNRVRLQSNTLTKEELAAFNSLVDDDFIVQGVDYLVRLSATIFKEQDGNPIVQYTHRQDKNTWKAAFFGTDPEAKLLRDASPLMRTGNQYHFVHRSVLEYLFSRVIYSPVKVDEEFDPQVETAPPVSQLLDANNPLFQRDLLQEPSIIQFLCDRVKLNLDFKLQLRAVIDRSKTDASAAIAATNAITILVRADVSFNGADLRGAKIPNADLSGGQFDYTQFQGADLTGVNFSKSWLRRVDMSDAHMEGVRFGELPYLEMDETMLSCTCSPDGKMLGAGLFDGTIYIYDTSTWTRMHRLQGHADRVESIVFSPDSQRLVSGSYDWTVRLWDTTSGEELLVMEKHSHNVISVTISPCGGRIVSASDDTTMRLWDAHTGESLFVLECDGFSTRNVKYSPDGRQLVSGGLDGMIRFWDAETGESGIVLSTSAPIPHKIPTQTEVSSRAYALDGSQLAFGCVDGSIRLWNCQTDTAGPVLEGHSRCICILVYSPCCRWIVSVDESNTVRLWDLHDMGLQYLLVDVDEHLGGDFGAVAFSSTGGQLAIHAGSVGNVAWNPVVPMELTTGAFDGSVQLWRMSIDEGGNIVFKMVWGPNLRILYTKGATFTNAVGLSPTHQKLLVQRGALPPSEEPTFPHD
ncbi:hypothetical protein KI688_006612 [Linnemannia hyalina]|uniref:WD40 repeat-like protein n=1 Tax=Linnemannia hyalina TaxID=64524 RepID=A0A9P7XJ13_9FUNG|nr:hypothetical protein KI688_006612 [Linnemannia hyalina]